MSKIHVLYVGDDDWTTKYSIPDNIEFEVYESDESELTANRPARKLMDLVILDRDITLSEEKAFTKFTRGYCLFATENVQMLNSATSRYFKARMGQYLYTGDVQYFLAHEVRNYYPNPYGEKFNPAKLAVSDSFTGRVACDGNYNLVLDGEFGENFSQIAYWRYNIPVFEGQCIDMYLEYEKTGDVEIKLRLFQFYYGSIGDIKQVWEFDEEQLQDVFRIDNESDQGPVFVSILARGTGSLNIISLHDRHSRRGHGFFLPGGERLVSSKGEEVFVYFEKGDMKPPLAVYFSGYRTQEGFEGYYMMRGFGCPFILVTDPRSEGGAFYLGDSEFEQMITDYVTDKLDELGLTKDELFETYGKHVVRIPTNRPLKRVDRKDRYFKNGHDQFWTAVDDVIRLHETGQPVLVVLNSVTDTDLFSRLLIEKNIPHNVLNASNAFWEAQIIAGAGQMNAVTVATTMAGRGTDIKLGDGVKELGGLAVIGIGRMNNSRSERQARGRAGRQGDPGFSQYYVSLEDDIVGAEDDDKLQRYIDGKKRIGKRKIKRIVNQCQKLSVESEEMNRKKSLQYDQVLQRQRDLIYATRKKLLDGASVGQEKIVEIAKGNISDFVNHFDCIQSNNKHGRRRGRKKDNDKNTNTEQYTSMLNRYILDNISYKLDTGLSRSDMQSAATVSDYLMLRVYQGLSRQRERIGDEEAYEQFVREATLKAVDDGWVELIDYLEQLKYAVAGRASAQRNVMFEYQNEAFESFLDTEKAVKCNIIRNILLSDVKIGKDGRLHVIYP